MWLYDHNFCHSIRWKEQLDDHAFTRSRQLSLVILDARDASQNAPNVLVLFVPYCSCTALKIDLVTWPILGCAEFVFETNL